MNAKIAAFFKKLKFCWWVLTNKEYQANNEPAEAKEVVPNITKLLTSMRNGGLLIDGPAKSNAPDKIYTLSDKEGKEFTFWECNGITHALNNHKEVIAQVLAKQDDS